MFIDTDRLYSRPVALPAKPGKEVDILFRVRNSPVLPIVGRVTLVYGNKRNRTYYINWFAAVGFEGQGYMTEGLEDLLPQLFENGVHRIVASIQPHNKRSLALAQRLGFRYEGTAVSSLRIGEDFVDVEYWAMVEGDLRTASIQG